MNKELYNKIKKLTDKDIETLNAFLSSRLTDAHNHNHYQQWYHMETYSRMSPYFIAAIGLDTNSSNTAIEQIEEVSELLEKFLSRTKRDIGSYTESHFADTLRMNGYKPYAEWYAPLPLYQDGINDLFHSASQEYRIIEEFWSGEALYDICNQENADKIRAIELTLSEAEVKLANILNIPVPDLSDYR